MTWEEVRAHLRSRWRVERDSPTEIVVSCAVPIGATEMTQAVGVAPTQVEGVPWLVLVAELFPETSLSARGALLYADRLAFGAIVLREDRYLLRSGAPLAGLALVDLDWRFTILVREAARLRGNLLGPSADKAARAFDNYSE